MKRQKSLVLMKKCQFWLFLKTQLSSSKQQTNLNRTFLEQPRTARFRCSFINLILRNNLRYVRTAETQLNGCQTKKTGQKLKIFSRHFPSFQFPEKFVKVGNALKNVNKSEKFWISSTKSENIVAIHDKFDLKMVQIEQ